MQIAPVSFNEIRTKNRVKKQNPISFKQLLPANAKVKLAILDIDETLRHWTKNSHWSDADEFAYEQPHRKELFEYLKKNKIKVVYSSDRGFHKIMPLIENGTLMEPIGFVCNNGGAIYKNSGGKFEEVTSWSENLSHFPKQKVREIVAEIANEPENMFPPDEWAKVPAEMIPEGQKEFRGSRITEYVGNETPINIRFIAAPGVKEKNIGRIDKALKEEGISAKMIALHYPGELLTFDGLRKYFEPKVAKDAALHYLPRLYPDKSADTLVISATDKGMASEYLREVLGLRPSEVNAAGDGENDFSNTNKGYFFTLVSNAVDGLKEMIRKDPKANAIEATKPGAEGILEVLA